jgi:hypothetical protein
MKEVCYYLYKNNNRKISVYYLTESEIKRKKINVDDCLALKFDSQNKDSDELYIRPDEALVIANLLIKAVHQTTKAYNMRFTKSDGQ